MSRRGAILEFAVLGLLHESDLHGYELRKRLSGMLGAFRAVSFGSLYPCLRTLVERGWITETEDGASTGKRPRITYSLTPAGRHEFQELMSQTGPQAWEDGNFDVHFAFFGMASSDVRLRILEGRRSRLEERRDAAARSAKERRERTDRYTAELQRHGLDSTDREVRWLSELIETERSAYGRPAKPSAATADDNRTANPAVDNKE